MPGHAPRHGMDGVAHFDAAVLELFGQLAYRVLCLGDGHAVAGDDYHAAGVGELDGRVGGASRAHRTGVLAGPGCALHNSAPADAAGDDGRDRAVHRLRHEVGEDRARGAHDHARDDQRGVVQGDTRRGRREPREGVQQRDHDGHVGAADRQHQEVAQQRRAGEHADEDALAVVAGGHVHGRCNGEGHQHEVDHLLRGPQRDRAPGDDFLQLAEGDIRPPKGDRADDRRKQGEDRDVGRDVGVAVREAELGPRYEEHGAAAHPVEQRHHLRHRRHAHLARRRHAYGRAECDAERD